MSGCDEYGDGGRVPPGAEADYYRARLEAHRETAEALCSEMERDGLRISVATLLDYFAIVRARIVPLSRFDYRDDGVTLPADAYLTYITELFSDRWVSR